MSWNAWTNTRAQEGISESDSFSHGNGKFRVKGRFYLFLSSALSPAWLSAPKLHVVTVIPVGNLLVLSTQWLQPISRHLHPKLSGTRRTYFSFHVQCWLESLFFSWCLRNNIAQPINITSSKKASLRSCVYTNVKLFHRFKIYLVALQAMSVFWGYVGLRTLRKP